MAVLREAPTKRAADVAGADQRDRLGERGAGLSKERCA
jgi:hypothetical protein